MSQGSGKPIRTEDRLIFALDVPEVEQAKKLVEALGSHVNFYKIGLELLMTGEYFLLMDWLIKRGKKVFVDLKFFDVPQTVASAITRLSNSGATFATIHGNDSIMRAAAKAKSGSLKILAVTALTSLDRGDLEDLGFMCNVRELVLSRARRALECGCDGVVSSGLEATELRKTLGDKLLIITPGIRPVENRPQDDQKRIVSVPEAFSNGADYIVVGRPIRDAASPSQAAASIQKQIASCFA